MLCGKKRIKNTSMAHRFSIKEIARHAGIGTATVDRVINNRANVSAKTRTRVGQAIAEMERQELQIAATGRQLFFDFVIEAPARFAKEVRTAAERVMPQFSGAVCRPRFMSQDIMTDAEVIGALNRIKKRGSHGVCLKARDTPAIRVAVNDMVSAGIPVVTLVTDISGTARATYVGLDNASAGRTAAFLIGRIVGDVTGSVLATQSDGAFLGEEERHAAFVQALAQHAPHLRVVKSNRGGGVHYQTAKDLGDIIGNLDNLRAVYSMGGGNKTILSMLDDHGLQPEVFVAHDLDQDNRMLIENRRIDFVLHHDLTVDLRQVFASFLAYHNLGPASDDCGVSAVHVITPDNVPARHRAANRLGNAP